MHDSQDIASISSGRATLSRRSVLGIGAVAASLLTTACTTAPLPHVESSNALKELIRLEKDAAVTIGVSAYDLETKRRVEHRDAEPFPMCSLFKVLAVAALLKSESYNDAYWNTGIPFSPADLVENSPITTVTTTWIMTLAELADAALRYSDNTAGNLLLRELGGPSEVTTFAKSLGALATRLDRQEPTLNEATPGDLRDTSTPSDIAKLYRTMLLDHGIGIMPQARLQNWMLRNTTSTKRIRAGLTGNYELADKTGAGSYGVVNDAGILWRPGKKPIVLTIMSRSDTASAANNSAVIADATRLILREFDR